MPKEVTKEEAKKIIKNKESIGLFYFSEEYEGITMYLGIDNSTGKAWVEAFYEKDDCFDWLNDEQKCRVCGCTWNSPCEGGCYWVEEDLCSKCAEKECLSSKKNMYIVTVTKVDGEIIKEPFGEEDRCSNCGRPISQSKEIISGRMITEEEWGCCRECADDLEDKCCCFEELGQYVYRKQTY